MESEGSSYQAVPEIKNDTTDVATTRDARYVFWRVANPPECFQLKKSRERTVARQNGGTQVPVWVLRAADPSILWKGRGFDFHSGTIKSLAP
jgi:hypothetical protein